MLNKITKWIFYIFSFLLPLAFLPESHFAYYFDKKIFLSVFVFLLFGSWLAKSFAANRLKYPAGKTAKAVLAIAAVFFASTALSGIFGPSFFGTSLQADSFFSFGLCFAIFFLSAAILEDGKEVLKSIKFFIGGSSVLALAFLVLGGLALAGQKVLNFGAGDLGQVLALVFGAGLTALVAVSTLGDVKIFKQESKLGKSLNIALPVLEGILLTAAISFVDFRLTWLLIILVSIVVFCRLLATPASKTSRLLVLGVFAASLFLLFFGLPFRVQFDYPTLPGRDLTLKIAQSTLMESPKNFLIGSGLTTFPYQFALHNGGVFNQTVLSGSVFDQGAFGFLTLLVETGILGAIAFLGLIGLLIWQGFKLLTSRDEEEKAVSVSFILIYYLFLIFFFFWINFGLTVLAFWALGMFAVSEKQKEVLFVEKPEMKKTAAAMIVLAGLTVSVFSIYASVQQYRAAMALQKDVQGKLDEAIVQTQKATGFWQQDDYYVLLSNLYIEQANAFLNGRKDPKAALSADEQVQLKNIADQAAAVANYACQLNPKRTSNWYNLGSIYGNPIFLVGDGGKAALEAYDKAEKLYPQNLSVFLGREFIYEALGEGDKALGEYQKYLNLVPPDSQAAATVRNKVEQLKQAIASSTSAVPANSETAATPDDVTLPTSTAPTSTEE
jgi:Flp pilus assembly protein TadD